MKTKNYKIPGLVYTLLIAAIPLVFLCFYSLGQKYETSQARDIQSIKEILEGNPLFDLEIDVYEVIYLGDDWQTYDRKGFFTLDKSCYGAEKKAIACELLFKNVGGVNFRITTSKGTITGEMFRYRGLLGIAFANTTAIYNIYIVDENNNGLVLSEEVRVFEIASGSVMLECTYKAGNLFNFGCSSAEVAKAKETMNDYRDALSELGINHKELFVYGKWLIDELTLEFFDVSEANE